MDNRKMFVAIGFAMMAVIAWQFFVQYLAQKNHWTISGQEQHQSQPQTPPPAATLPTTQAEAMASTAPSEIATPTEKVAAPVMKAGMHVASAATTQPAQISIGSGIRNDSTYSIGIELMQRGAAIAQVELNQYKQTVEANNSYTYEQPLPIDSPQNSVLGTDSVTIDGQSVDLSSANWQLVSHTPASAVFAVKIDDPSGKAIARVEKTYQVYPKDDRRLGYEAHVSQRIQNLSGRPLKVQTSVNGTVAPIREIEEADERQIIAGYPSDNEISPGYWMLSDFVKTPSRNLTFEVKTKKPMRWAGASSVYFLAIVRPEPAPKGMASMPLASVTASALNPGEKSDAAPQIATVFQTEDVTIQSGASAELPLSVFFGPKKRSVIANAYYSAPPLGYDAAFRTTSHGFCGFCAFQPLINILVDMLRGFHFVLRDWGLAIIALVMVVRLILHPITRKSTISMQKMQKMGPEMEKLKTKYKDNQEELNKAMVQFYKEQGVTPILGCLPMLLQTPIWIALWEALQNTFELRQAPFLHPWGIPLTWIHDLARPDSIYTFAHPIPLLFGWHLHSINLLPLLMAVAMYLQQKFTPRAATMTKEQASQQKMMVVMSTLLFPLMLYTGPSGLNLYILTSSAVGIWESKIIRDHILRKEEAEKEGKVFVEPTRKVKRSGGGAVAVKEAPKTGLAGWFARMQQMAEQQRQMQQKKTKRK